MISASSWGSRLANAQASIETVASPSSRAVRANARSSSPSASISSDAILKAASWRAWVYSCAYVNFARALRPWSVTTTIRFSPSS